jgi:hypothetical protein
MYRAHLSRPLLLITQIRTADSAVQAPRKEKMAVLYSQNLAIVQ